jgi:hypothetical protein
MADSRSRTTEDDRNPGVAPQYERNALYLNTGTGHFLEAAYLAGLQATDWTWSPRLEDLDNDGRLDIFVTNGFNRDPDADAVARMLEATSQAERIKVLFDSPVKMDTHLAFHNLGDLRFESVGPEWGLDKKGVSFGAAFGDLGGDGNLDIVYTNYGAGVTVLRNDCDTGHVVNVDLRGTVSNRFGIGATVKIESALGAQVRQLMLARGYMSSSEPMVHFGLGKDAVIKKMTVTWPSGHVQKFENLAVDRRYTVTEPSGPIPLPADAARPPGQFAEVGGSVGLAFRSREEYYDEGLRAAVDPGAP